jgi:hypothetical protein
MEKETVIHIRDLFKTIKLVSSQDNKEYSINIILKLDNDTWIDERSQELFWDDDNGICYYFHYNQIRSITPNMIGRDKVVVPACISAFDYGEIQEIKMLLNEEALRKLLNDFSSFKAYNYRNGKQEELDDTLKALIIKNYISNTNAATDENFKVRDQYAYK